ncbi:hypothetical protein B0H15DRAFT_830832 [Mycena belliarum]|uniref:Uncharacterized protein n=1 Tax=Mycena belliarum TaxID=1033014 RepID=A0AAD6XPH7_9AGAR|nr:hypothetical protein B0H15DRAFT_830832 [Mycena belliae]
MAFSTTTTAASSTETCMSLAVSCLTGPQSQSFEEVRIADYLTSYRATGRPPPPCPPYPTDPAARAAQRLPPLFVPMPFPSQGPASGLFASGPSPFGIGSGAGAGAASTSTAPPITDPTRLPAAQTFTVPVRAPEGEQFASIAAVPEYRHWSPDELRYYAYARGARHPPPGTPLFAFVPLSPSTSSVPAPTAPLPQDAGDTFVSISCRPEFAGHSVEELRLSFLRTGAELTSAQLFAGATSTSAAPTTNPSLNSILGPPAPPLALSSSSTGLGSAFAPTPAPARPLFGAAHSQQQTPLRPALFGAAQQPTPVQSFSFGAPAAPTATAPSMFGAAPQAPAGGGFSFGGPSAGPAPGGGLFGAPQPPAQTQQGQGFSFGGTPAASGGAGGTGFAFGARRGF